MLAAALGNPDDLAAKGDAYLAVDPSGGGAVTVSVVSETHTTTSVSDQ